MATEKQIRDLCTQYQLDLAALKNLIEASEDYLKVKTINTGQLTFDAPLKLILKFRHNEFPHTIKITAHFAVSALSYRLVEHSNERKSNIMVGGIFTKQGDRDPDTEKYGIKYWINCVAIHQGNFCLGKTISDAIKSSNPLGWKPFEYNEMTLRHGQKNGGHGNLLVHLE